jgi:hypothetical protein
MKQTLENADRFAKVTLALSVILSYSLELITGKFAFILFILACIALLAFLISAGFKWLTMD